MHLVCYVPNFVVTKYLIDCIFSNDYKMNINMRVFIKTLPHVLRHLSRLSVKYIIDGFYIDILI